MLISSRACFFHILIQPWSPTFQLQMFLFHQHLSKPLDKRGSSFSLPLGMPLITRMPAPLATGLLRLSQRDPCHTKARVRLSHSFNAKTQSEAVRKTLRRNKEYFCSCPSPPPGDHKHGDSTQELLQSFFKSNKCFCTGNTLVIRGREGREGRAIEVWQ